jgi:hypothetical protein
VRAFVGNTDVSFADVNLRDAPIRGEPHNPGIGGWPTIRYFNAETGPDGKSYEKKTSKSMCEELGDEEVMFQYIEEAGRAFCKVDGKGCDERSLKFMEKMKEVGQEEQQNQVDRLVKMMDDPMADELKKWVKQRVKILQQLLENVEVKVEL